MKHGAIVGNIGHFDNEIDVAGLTRTPGIERINIKPQVDQWKFAEDRAIILLSDGRLLNLGNATGHPSFVMSNSFSNQTIAQIGLWTKNDEYDEQVYVPPKHLDEKVARLHLDALGAKLTALRPEQAAYIGVPVEAPTSTTSTGTSDNPIAPFCNLEHGMAEVSAAGHPSATEWFWSELRIIRERWDVLHHPFYIRWSAGELTPVELQRYAEAFDHAVIALAVVSRRAAAKACGMLKDILESYAAEEEANIALWRQCARSAGEQAGAVLDIADDPSPGTVECARVWAGDDARGLAVDLVTPYAIEASQPPLARTVLDALVERYGCTQGLATSTSDSTQGLATSTSDSTPGSTSDAGSSHSPRWRDCCPLRTPSA